jgi:hypothetical protein
MAEKVVLPESKDQLVEKWLPVIEGTGKWEKVVDGAPKVKDYNLMATQLEILEQVELSEASQSGAVATYTPVLIPMVRRVMPALIGNEIFGTQPMNGPSGMIFALKSLYTGDSDNPITGAAGSNPGRIVIVDDAAGIAVGETISSTATAATGVVRHKENNTLLVDVLTGTFAVADDVDNAATFTAGIAVVSFVGDAEALQQIVFSNYSGTYTTALGEVLSTDTKELGFEIISNTVNAQTRKLKAKWTMEVEDDLRAVHGMNAEQLLSGFCSDEMVRELNSEFIAKVKSLAGAAATWTYTADAGSTGQGRFENEKYLALANEISRQKLALAKKSMRGQATWMIVSSGVLTALKAMGMQANSDAFDNTFMGVYDGMKVYIDLYNTEAQDFIYFGYKGASEVDAGLFYCPYVPLKVNKGYGEEDNIPRLFFSTRYGMGENPFGAGNYYSKLIVSTLPKAS